MSTKEIKTEIKKAIENVPEKVLLEVLDYLNKKKKDGFVMSDNLDKIIKEDEELLKKLAQ